MKMLKTCNICQTQRHASREKTGAIISTNLPLTNPIPILIISSWGQKGAKEANL